MSDEHSADQRWRSATQLVLFLLCYNYRVSKWRYRLGVRTEDSQSSNPGSIPGSATNTFQLPPAESAISLDYSRTPTDHGNREKAITWCHSGATGRGTMRRVTQQMVSKLRPPANG